ncbi:MAG: M3 family oligoendopeptidase [Candidatus Nomurabacteria bacterium]|nr:M3 family oligoendopeptidase [Candidatus Nomurabacteria bacterium]
MKKEKTSWNFGLLYKNEKDPQIEKDMQEIENLCGNFEKKYKKLVFIKNPLILSKAMDDYEKLCGSLNKSKPWWYFTLRKDINAMDEIAQSASTKFQQRITVATNKITFFTLEIGKIPAQKQKSFLANKSLLKYSYFLGRIFETAKYSLSEKEEQLKDLLSQSSYEMWVDGQEKVLNQQTVEHKGKQIPISQAMNILADLPKKDRRDLHQLILKSLKSISYFAEAEMNAICNYKKVNSDLRGFKKPYSSTILAYENDEKTIETLVSTVTKGFKVSRRFYKLHSELLGEKQITLADRGVKIGEIKKKFDFNTSVEIVSRAFTSVDKKYADMLHSFISNEQFDVYPKKGKRGGAYCWGMGSLPIFVLLNHSDNIRSVETLAHEMGHAIHGELSRTQPVLYRGHPISTAEVASTFFEQVAINSMESLLSDEEKIIFLHNKIMGDITTIFRQIALFNFECELHQKIATEGQVSKEEISRLMAKNLRSYLGDSVKVEDEDGYCFVSWSHIRRFFYVYSYAYGQLISRALFENWKKDPAYAKKVEQFLSAGRSMSPKDIFKSIGIDTSDPKFFETGIKSIENDIKKLELLAKKFKK